MNAKVLSIVSLVIGAVGVCGEFGNFFLSRHGAIGILGAILIAGGVIGLAIVQTRSGE